MAFDKNDQMAALDAALTAPPPPPDMASAAAEPVDAGAVLCQVCDTVVDTTTGAPIEEMAAAPVEPMPAPEGL